MPNDFLEKTLEDIVYENKDTICERGFPFLLDNTLRQFVLPSGRKMDLFSYSISEDSIQCKIFELKREKIIPKHIIQVLDYSAEVYCYLYPNFKNIHIERVVVGNDIDKSAISLIQDMLNFETYLYKFDYNGLMFNKYKTILELGEEFLNSILKPDEKTENFKFRLVEIDKNRG
jgi:hypothetical protein